MRIMHIIYVPGPGGAETYVKDLALHTKRSGHEVCIVFLTKARKANQTFEQAYIHSLETAGIKYRYIGIQARYNPIFGIFRLRKICNHFQPDIIHSHLYYGAIYTSFIKNVTRIYTHHNIRVNKSWILHKYLDWHMDAFVGICTACSIKLQSCVQKKVVQIDNGVDINRLQIQETREDSTSPIVVAIGSLTEQKNFSHLLRTIAKVNDLTFTVKIAGDGPKRAELEKECQALGLCEKVTFLGTITDVPDLLSNADIFVMSSAWEGLPISQIEATLSGLPVLVTDVGGCAEIVDVAQNGFVVPLHDLDAYVTALRTLISDQSLRQQFSTNAVNQSGRYDLRNSLRLHLNLYQTLQEKLHPSKLQGQYTAK